MSSLLRVALTGGIGSGKSHCLSRLAALGAPTIDADILARAAVAPGTPGLAAIVRRFGEQIADASGHLQRKVLAAVVFHDSDARRDLEAIIHPAVFSAIDGWFARLERDQTLSAKPVVAIADVPLLFETGHEHSFDRVVVCACAEAQQVTRVMKRDGLSEAEARQRIAAQLPLAEKRRRADYVIDTSGTLADTDTHVARVWAALVDDAKGLSRTSV